MKLIVDINKKPSADKISDFIKNLSISEQEAMINFIQGIQFVKRISDEESQKTTA